MAVQDSLTLGPITFDAYSTPDIMSSGGRQAMVVHKLPGGARVIDELGPDEMDIIWRGHFFGANAYSTVLTLDALRKAGNVLALSWAGQSRAVIIANFIYSIRRLPLWVEYVITCTVVTNSPNTAPSNTAIDNQVSTDLTTATNNQKPVDNLIDSYKGSMPSPQSPGVSAG